MTSSPSEPAVEGSWPSSVMGDALARAHYSSVRATGTLATNTKRVNYTSWFHLQGSGWHRLSVDGSRKRITVN